MHNLFKAVLSACMDRNFCSVFSNTHCIPKGDRRFFSAELQLIRRLRKGTQFHFAKEKICGYFLSPDLACCVKF